MGRATLSGNGWMVIGADLPVALVAVESDARLIARLRNRNPDVGARNMTSPLHHADREDAPMSNGDIARICELLRTSLTTAASARQATPSASGLYSWWMTPGQLPGITGPTDPGSGRQLIYVGIASNLRRRVVGNHLGRRTGSSTLRRSLAALLMQDQGWSSTWKSDRVVLIDDAETELTTWMEEQLQVSWVVHDHPQDVESAVISQMSPPLNLADNSHHPLYTLMVSARSRWRQSAGVRPVKTQ